MSFDSSLCPPGVEVATSVNPERNFSIGYTFWDGEIAAVKPWGVIEPWAYYAMPDGKTQRTIAGGFTSSPETLMRNRLLELVRRDNAIDDKESVARCVELIEAFKRFTKRESNLPQ